MALLPEEEEEEDLFAPPAKYIIYRVFPHVIKNKIGTKSDNLILLTVGQH